RLAIPPGGKESAGEEADRKQPVRIAKPARDSVGESHAGAGGPSVSAGLGADLHTRARYPRGPGDGGGYRLQRSPYGSRASAAPRHGSGPRIIGKVPAFSRALCRILQAKHHGNRHPAEGYPGVYVRGCHSPVVSPATRRDPTIAN